MSEYRNVELSFPRFERDGLRFLTFGSPALGGNRGEVTLFAPAAFEDLRNIPLVVLLHGVLGSHWSWVFNGGAHLTALDMIVRAEMKPMVLAMPSDGLHLQGSGYLSLPEGDFERWIVEDVVDCVTDLLPCLGPESKRFLAGFSMGGYGALRLGAKYTGRFDGISGHSSITDFDQFEAFIQDIPKPMAPREELSVVYWMRQNHGRIPATRFDCGIEDKLIEANRSLHEQLDYDGIPHAYREFEGRHSWDYWEEHLRDSFRFFDDLS